MGVAMIQISLHIRPGITPTPELCRILLVHAGISEEEIAENIEKKRHYLSFYRRTHLQAARIMKRLRSCTPYKITLSCRMLKDEQWKTRWKKYFKPFAITDDIRIVPAWLKGRIPGSARSDIFIDTSVAFGTGLHATTRLMASFIASHRRHIGNFLDVGTGSGILSLIAHSYGADTMCAIDCDRHAIATAKNNFLLNHCTTAAARCVDFSAFRNRRPFTFIAANLLTADLIRFKKTLLSHLAPGGYLAVSGIYRDNYRLFRTGFSDPRVRCVRVRTKKGWYALLFRRIG
jgi:ribosomal protein L11 methyltransferase